MSAREDVRIIRERLECAKAGTTTAALEALSRLEDTLPKASIMEQFEALAVGTRFRTGKGSVFVKVSDKAVVRSYLSFGDLESEYYSDVYRVDQYAHWKNYDDEIVPLS